MVVASLSRESDFEAGPWIIWKKFLSAKQNVEFDNEELIRKKHAANAPNAFLRQNRSGLKKNLGQIRCLTIENRVIQIFT